MVAKIAVVGIGSAEIAAVGSERFEGNQGLGILRAGERVEQDGVDPTEHGGAGADSESEREDGERGEAVALAEDAESVGEILEEGAHLGGDGAILVPGYVVEIVGVGEGGGVRLWEWAGGSGDN